MLTRLQRPPVWFSLPPGLFSWRWVHVAVAALAMVATLPGRTHGLGLFTEPILNSLHLDRESYGFIGLWATLLGGLFCLPCGWLIDRYGTRAVMMSVMILLGVVVIVMSRVEGVWTYRLDVPLPWETAGASTYSVVLLLDLFLLVLLTRGLGQSALSVASLALIGRSAGRRTGLAMGVYAFLTALGFSGAIWVIRAVTKSHPEDWRPVWAGIGGAVIVAGLISGLLIRTRLLDADPAQPGKDEISETNDESKRSTSSFVEPSFTLRQGLRSPAFWTVSLSTSFFGMASSGIALFNQSILEERHFHRDVFLNVAIIGFPVGLVSNLLSGWLATRWPIPRVLALGMGLLGIALFAFRYVQDETQVYLYAIGMAAAGGIITVCFFTAWRRGFGPAHLGQIQGAAQWLTVVFSALGQPLFATTQARLHSYLPLFSCLAAVSLLLAVITWLVDMPVLAKS